MYNDFPYTIWVGWAGEEAPICKIVHHKSQPPPRGVNLKEESVEKVRVCLVDSSLCVGKCLDFE